MLRNEGNFLCMVEYAFDWSVRALTVNQFKLPIQQPFGWKLISPLTSLLINALSSLSFHFHFFSIPHQFSYKHLLNLQVDYPGILGKKQNIKIAVMIRCDLWSLLMSDVLWCVVMLCDVPCCNVTWCEVIRLEVLWCEVIWCGVT